MKNIAIAVAFAVGAFGPYTASAAEGSQPGGGAAIEKPDAAARAARAVDCNKQADARGLHMKERKKFLSDCKKGL